MTTIQVALGVFLSSALLAQSPPAPPKGARSPAKPSPPLEVTKPKTPAKTHGGGNLSEVDADDLTLRAREAARQKDLAGAIQLLHLAELKEPRGQGYDLACYCARARRIDEAIYWLQDCAMSWGCDAEYAAEDEDLAAVRADERWAPLRDYLKACNDYWTGSGHRREVLTVPAGHDPKSSIPVVIALHGLASRPEDFSGEPEQGLANRWQVAFLAVSGTRARGPQSFVWSEDPEADRKHVMAALERVKDKVTAKKGHLVLMGFSQGAQVAFEMAIRDPVAFAGAIAMSPGFRGPVQLDAAKRSPLLGKRAYVLTSYSGEHVNTVKRASADATWAREAGALVIEHTFPGSVHSFPPHYGSNLAAYLQTILGVKERFGK